MPIVTKKELRHFIHDRQSVLLLLASGVLALVTVLTVVFRVRGSDLQVPIRYTQYSLNLNRGDWTVLYELALFVALVLALNGALAVKIRALRRSYAIGLLILTLLIMIVALLVSNALLGLAA